MADLTNEQLIVRTAVQNSIERDIENIYNPLKIRILSSLDKQPLLKTMANNYVSAKEDIWISKAQEIVDLSIENVFINPDISADEAVEKVIEFLNSALDQVLEKQVGINLCSMDINAFEILKKLSGVK